MIALKISDDTGSNASSTYDKPMTKMCWYNWMEISENIVIKQEHALTDRAVCSKKIAANIYKTSLKKFVDIILFKLNRRWT